MICNQMCFRIVASGAVGELETGASIIAVAAAQAQGACSADGAGTAGEKQSHRHRCSQPTENGKLSWVLGSNDDDSGNQLAEPVGVGASIEWVNVKLPMKSAGAVPRRR